MGKNNKKERQARNAELKATGAFAHAKTKTLTNSEQNKANRIIKNHLPDIVAGSRSDQYTDKHKLVALMAGMTEGRLEKTVTKPPKNDKILQKAADAIETFLDEEKALAWGEQNPEHQSLLFKVLGLTETNVAPVINATPHHHHRDNASAQPAFA